MSIDAHLCNTDWRLALGTLDPTKFFPSNNVLGPRVQLTPIVVVKSTEFFPQRLKGTSFFLPFFRKSVHRMYVFVLRSEYTMCANVQVCLPPKLPSTQNPNKIGFPITSKSILKMRISRYCFRMTALGSVNGDDDGQ